jgi:hypothetical protein
MPDSTPPEPVLALRPIDARKTEEPTTKGSRGQKRIPDSVRGRKIGRPTGYRPAYIDQAFKFCLLGLDDKRIAVLLGTSRAGLDRWKRAYPRFREAFERGRDRADAAVAGALYKRAMGYSHPAEKIHVTKDGDVIKVPYTQHYPPDTAALNFFLANRQRELWRRDPAGGDVNVNLSLHDLVMGAIKLREAEKADPKLIEHAPEPTERESER